METKYKIVRGVTVSMSVDFFIPLIRDFQEMGCEVVCVSSDGPELKMVEEAGGRVVTVEMERRISPLKDLKSLWNMIKVFRCEKPDMVHSMTPKAGLICMLAGKLTGVPVRVHTFTGLVFPTSTGFKRRLLMATDWLTCACATHVIPEGEGVKRDLLENGITRKPIRVLGYGNVRGIDLDRFDPNREDIRSEAAGIRKPDVFTFITIGRIVGDKGINEMVEAFSRLHRENPATRLIIVGGYEEKIDPVSDKTKREIDTNPAIQAVGIQKDVRPWLLASDCAILASYREGFPNVVIEAGAMGLPQIVTDINGANEIIVDGQNGIIVPSKDANALYEAMKRMVEDKEMHNQMIQEARPLIATRFEQGFVRACLKDFYRQVLKKRK